MVGERGLEPPRIATLDPKLSGVDFSPFVVTCRDLPEPSTNLLLRSES